MPLKIIIVGAGIAGLCASVALRQAGHSVKIYEKSQFAAEIGAALSLSPNGVCVLKSLGFSFERARARQMMVWESVDGTTLKRLSTLDFEDAEEKYGAPFMVVHRVDLHTELLRLALQDGEGKGKGLEPATLKLRAPVVGIDTQAGVIELEDGSKHRADLVVAADGLHSVVRSVALENEANPTSSGLSAFRFLVPTRTIKEDPALTGLLEWKAPGATILADTRDTVNERHAVWYDCQGGEVQNFVGIHPTRNEDTESGPQSAAMLKDSMLQEFSHYHPDIVKILMLSEEVKCWPLFIHDPITKWEYGKAILIGDAAHPMLPFGGQGSNQAIEDGGALGYLLKGVECAAAIPARLKLFDQVRRNRASRVQTLSKVRIGKEEEVEQELKRYTDDADSAVPRSFPERIAHDFGFNVLERCDEVLSQA